jgi:hypothetical protein
MHRHDEMILGARERHVQQPRLFGPAGQLLVRGHIAKRAAGHLSEADQRRVTVPAQAGLRIGGVGTTEAGNHRDRELQTFRSVHGHDAHRILALVGAELDSIDVVDAPVDPRQILGNGSTGRVTPGTRFVDHVAHPPPGLTRHPLALAERCGNPSPAVVQLGGNSAGVRSCCRAELVEHATHRRRPVRQCRGGSRARVWPRRPRIDTPAPTVVDAEDRGSQRLTTTLS